MMADDWLTASKQNWIDRGLEAGRLAKSIQAEIDRLIMDNKTLTERELKEVQHALYYAAYLHHGTVGHNQLMLLAQFAQRMGFGLAGDNVTMIIPSGWTVVSDSPEKS